VDGCIDKENFINIRRITPKEFTFAGWPYEWGLLLTTNNVTI
jgi:hypothetical protein